jgi:topoisomerase-4 subunit A
MDATKKKQNWLSENTASRLILLTDVAYPLIKVTYGGADDFRGSEEIDAEQFIAVKGFKAKGKRLSTYQIESIEELEPVRFPEPTESSEDAEDLEPSDFSEDLDDSEQSNHSEPNIELSLFNDEE